MNKPERFKITNTTVKPIRKGKNGEDLRTMTEKVGHSVQFRDEHDRAVILTQGRSAIINSLLPGIMELQRGGFVTIEPITDIAAALKEHSLQAEQERAAKRQAAEAKKADPNVTRKARAVEMGKDTHEQRGGSEHEDAVNPDGNPNFLAKASKNRKRKGVKDGLSADTGVQS